MQIKNIFLTIFFVGGLLESAISIAEECFAANENMEYCNKCSNEVNLIDNKPRIEHRWYPVPRTIEVEFILKNVKNNVYLIRDNECFRKICKKSNQILRLQPGEYKIKYCLNNELMNQFPLKMQDGCIICSENDKNKLVCDEKSEDCSKD